MTLDADVAAEIERIRKTEGKRFKQVLNEVLRARPGQVGGETTRGAWVSPIHPIDTGEVLFDVVSTSRALAYAEGEDYK